MNFRRFLVSAGAVIVLGGCASSTNSASTANTPPTPPPSPPSGAQADAQKYGIILVTRGATSGVKQKIGRLMYLNEDCSSVETPTMRIVDPPAHGRLTFEPGEDYPDYAKDNVRSACNGKLHPSVWTFYTADAGYAGSDSATTQQVWSDGSLSTIQYRISVASGSSGAASLANPAVATPLVQPNNARNSFFYVKAAPTGARQKIDYYMSLNPDCSSIGRAIAHIIDAPANGSISFEEGSDFPNYDKDNLRFECNKKSAPSLRVFTRRKRASLVPIGLRSMSSSRPEVCERSTTRSQCDRLRRFDAVNH